MVGATPTANAGLALASTGTCSPPTSAPSPDDPQPPASTATVAAPVSTAPSRVKLLDTIAVSLRSLTPEARETLPIRSGCASNRNQVVDAFHFEAVLRVEEQRSEQPWGLIS